MTKRMAKVMMMQKLNLPEIRSDTHKYARGSLLVVGGSARYPGAAILAAKAGALAGAGYVSLAVPTSAVAAAQAHLLSIPVIRVPELRGAFVRSALDFLLATVRHADAMVLGPGMTLTDSTCDFVCSILKWRERRGPLALPLVVDADGLGALSDLAQKRVLVGPAPESPTCVLTPHQGELDRLCQATRTGCAAELASFYHAVVVHKGPTTTITDGVRSQVVDEGSAALATAGTGDVLAGVIGSLLAQNLRAGLSHRDAAFEAAVSGVILHARAGRVAEHLDGIRSVTAESVLEAIPAVLRDTLDATAQQ
jgi:NAD(P)H-hydrate epimerase